MLRERPIQVVTRRFEGNGTDVERAPLAVGRTLVCCPIAFELLGAEHNLPINWGSIGSPGLDLDVGVFASGFSRVAPIEKVAADLQQIGLGVDYVFVLALRTLRRMRGSAVADLSVCIQQARSNVVAG